MSEDQRKWLDILSCSIGALSIAASMYFIWLITECKYFPRWFIHLIIIITVIISGLNFIPDFLIQGRNYQHVGDYFLYSMIPGPFMPIYYIFTGILLLLIVYIFFKGYLHSTGLEKIRLKFVGIGLVIASILCIGTAIWVPLFVYILTRSFVAMGAASTNISIIFAAMSTSLFSIFSAYAITRYRFMNIKVVLKKSIFYGATMIVSVAIVLFITATIYAYIPSFIVPALAMIIVIVFGEKYKQKIKILLDGIFFMNEIDLSKRISENIKKINSTHELETFVFELVAGIQDIVKADVLDIYITERQHNRYKGYYSKHSKSSLSFDSKIVDILRNTKSSLIVAEELMQQNQRSTAELLQFMRSKKSEIIILLQNTKLLGIIFIGKKKDGKVYLENELESLQKFIKDPQFHLQTLINWHEALESAKVTIKEQAFLPEE